MLAPSSGAGSVENYDSESVEDLKPPLCSLVSFTEPRVLYGFQETPESRRVRQGPGRTTRSDKGASSCVAAALSR